MGKDAGRAITLNVPTMFTDLRADSGTLLHEMVHQYLNERGEPAGHDSEGWRREIMRLHELVTGKKIWAGASITKRQDGRIKCPKPDGESVADAASDCALAARGAGFALGVAVTYSCVLYPAPCLTGAAVMLSDIC
jgi:hypothetical protein